MGKLNLRGKVFRHHTGCWLKVVRFAGFKRRTYGGRRHSYGYWWCECSCGNRVKVLTSSLRQGRTSSCGCLRKRLARYKGQGQRASELEQEVFRLHQLGFSYRAMARMVQRSPSRCCALVRRVLARQTSKEELVPSA